MTKANKTIVLSPGQLRSEAENAVCCCQKMEQALNRVDKTVCSSQYFWDTESARLLRKNYQEDKPDIEAAKTSLHRQLEKLETILRQYEQAEKDTVAATAALPDTVLD